MNSAMNFARVLNKHVNMFCAGLVDSLSFHRAAKFVVNSDSVRQEIGLTWTANGFLLVGSHFLYEYFVQPVSQLMMTSVSKVPENSNSAAITIFSVWSFYHLLWMLPVWALCYVVSLGCYQTIAEDVYRLNRQDTAQGQRGASASTPAIDVKRSISGVIYSWIVWVFMFVQLRVFDLIFPSSLELISRVLHSLINALHLNDSLMKLVIFTVIKPLQLASDLFRILGLVFGSVVYGWYGFDLVWIADGQQPEKRFTSVEEHWVYFFGFGLPYFLLSKCTSFFMGYGIYLMIYPFTIMLGAVSDFRQHASKGENQDIVVFHVFQIAQNLSLRTIKSIDKYMRPAAHIAKIKKKDK